MQRLEVLGWWFHEQAPDGWPRPQALVARWDAAERAVVARYLRAGKVLVSYAEASFCRFACGERDMGCSDLTDGTFVWPEGLVHYVEQHAVRLPERFVAHARARGGEVAPFALPEPAFGLFDTGPWLQWARAEGACLDLDGWEIPDRDAARRIAAAFGGLRGKAIVLCRADTRQVVLALADGALEVHWLAAAARPPQRFAGWHEWPLAR